MLVSELPWLLLEAVARSELRKLMSKTRRKMFGLRSSHWFCWMLRLVWLSTIVPQSIFPCKAVGIMVGTEGS